ncbi:AAA family ATPase [Candidatus Poribacteria bacterium]|nr:AAA family ATPase [Candidatus Poribacteria bacterium]
MKTIAILSRKGGTGKTTIATNLAIAAEKAGQTTALIDLDPQSSAAKWGDSRNGNTPAVISTHSERLPKILQLAEDNGATLTILDTAPHTEASALDAARAADMVVIPCKPALVDLQAIGSTIDVIRLAKVSARIVFNSVPSRGNLTAQAREAVSIYEVPCAPCELGHRIAYVHAYNAGLAAQEFEPSGKASREVRALYKYLTSEMDI